MTRTLISSLALSLNTLPLVHSAPSTLTSSLFLAHVWHALFTYVFPMPKTLFSQIFTWLPPSVPSSFYLKVFSVRHTHTHTLALHWPLPHFFTIKCTTRKVISIATLYLIDYLSPYPEWKLQKFRKFYLFFTAMSSEPKRVTST